MMYIKIWGINLALALLMFNLTFNGHNSTTVHFSNNKYSLTGQVKFKSKQGIYSNFRFVSRNKFIVVNDSPDSTWIKGSPFMDGSGVVCEVNMGKIPSQIKELIGQKFRVYNAKNESKLVTVTNIRMLSVCTPHFGYYQNAEQEGWTSEQKNQGLFDMGRLTLTAQVDISEDFEAVWAMQSTLPETIFPIVKNESMQSQAFGEIKKSAEISAIQAEFKKSEVGKDAANWYDYEKVAEDFKSVTSKNTSYYFGYISVGNPCGGPFSKNINLFASKANGQSFSGIKVNEAGMPIIAVLDIDQDGVPEFLGKDFNGLFLLDHSGEKILSFEDPFYDCPC